MSRPRHHYDKRMSSGGHKWYGKKTESKRTKLLKEAIELQHNIERNKGRPLSDKQMDKVLEFSEKVDAFEGNQIRTRHANDPMVIFVQADGSRSAGLIRRPEGHWDVEFYNGDSEVGTHPRIESPESARGIADAWVKYGIQA